MSAPRYSARAHHLHVRFPRARSGERYTAVKDTTLAVAAGEFVSVVGPTGCGKSTLLNVAAGLLQPSSGNVRRARRRACRHQPPRGLHVPGRLADAVAQCAGQRARRTPIRRRRARASPSGARANGSAAWGSPGFEARYPHELSGGMRKRVALAQMLILDPQIC